MSLLEITGFDCGGEQVLRAIKFISGLLDVIFILLPILLTLLLVIDFIKNIMASSEDDMKKRTSLIIKRVIICIAVFLVEPITHMAINTIGNNKDNYVTCIKIAKETEDLSIYEIKVPEVKNDKNYSFRDKKTIVVNPKEIQGSYDIKDKENIVAIMYSTIHDAAVKSNPKGTLITETNNYTKNVFYYWGEPALGFYKSSDKKVIKTHMQQLSDAGIDFIIIDNTNIISKWGSWNLYVTTPMTALLDTIVEMRKSGKKTPYVVNWINTGHELNGNTLAFKNWSAVEQLYNEFYKQTKYKDIWVYWNGKPFILTTSTPTKKANLDIYTRSMWVYAMDKTHVSNWSYLEGNNSSPGLDSEGNTEQISVSAAVQQGYMSDGGPFGRRGGKTFKEQWENAFKIHPKIVTITWWNEWVAQHQGNGNFVDEYNQEYSRDIEPMKGGHGDKYYEWMKKYIAAYKSNEKCPENLID